MPEIPDVIQAKAFQLVDDNGKVRAELSMSQGSPEFKLLDGEGKAVVSATVFESGQPSLLLGNILESGLHATIFEGHPSLALIDVVPGSRTVGIIREGVNGAIRLGIDSDKAMYLRFLSSDGSLGAEVDAFGKPTLSLVDKESREKGNRTVVTTDGIKKNRSLYGEV